MSLQFVWDDNKAVTNTIKHQVTFEEASTVFADPLAVIFDDEAHSVEEIREIILGHSTSNRLILVSFTERDGIVRIISARRATPKERRDYESNT
ncbi:MAG TPA: BrnT family toxin [Herpetosiphonaceae bacterium]